MLVRTEADLDTWRREWRAFHLLLSLADVGVIDRLVDGADEPVPAMAAALGADARALDIGLRMLAARGLVVLDGERVRLSAAGRSMATALRGLRGEHGDLGDVSDLATRLRTGTPAFRTHGGVDPADPTAARTFLGRLHRRSEDGARDAAAVVREACAGTASPRILDVGGGHGRYAATIAATVPGARVTLFDRPVVLPIARELSGEGFDTRGGDFLVDDLGGPYDCAFLSNIIHGEGESGCATLFRRLRAVIAPGGCVVVKDMFLDETGSLPERAADFGLIMLLYTAEGRSWTRSRMAALLATAGFPRTTGVECVAEGYGFLVAR
jgi:hypothetical protein